jgi:hypothetical protein
MTLFGLALTSSGLRTLKSNKVTLINIKGMYQGWTSPETLKGKRAKFIAVVDITGGLFFLIIGSLIMLGEVMR